MSTKNKKYSERVVKSFIKDYPSPVYDSLLGIALTNKNVVVLENHCIVMRRDHKLMKGKVKIMGGGGAGNEPSDAYFVGTGMLTAAVVGDVFTAPSAHEILIAIRELAIENPDGVLLLVKNYLGDNLNFRIALEDALSENINVKMVVIGDDVFCHMPVRYGRKGSAGTVLIYKIAGEMAEEGEGLEEIAETCKEILNNIATVSVMMALSASICNSFSTFIESDELLLGAGINGRGGAKTIKFTNLQDVVTSVINEIFSFLNLSPTIIQENVIILINNLGATTKLEEAIITKEVSFQLRNLGFRPAKMYVGTFMSSMGTYGFSVTLLKDCSPDIINWLNASTSAPAWPGSESEDIIDFEMSDLPITVLPENQVTPNQSVCQSLLLGPALSEKAVGAMKLISIFAAEAIISCEKQLNTIDSEIGDGDAGTVLKKGAEALRKAVIENKINLHRPFEFLIELSNICCKYMGGVTGALYKVFFKAAGLIFQNSEEITPEVCSLAFREAVNAVKCYGNAELGDRTLLDVLHPALDSFESAFKHGKNLSEAVYLAAITCEFKSEETKCLIPSCFPALNSRKVLLYPDAGCHAATIWFRAITFKSDDPYRSPGVFLWELLNEEESNYALGSELSSAELLDFIEKKIESDQTLLMILLLETIKFCRKNYKKDPRRTSALVGTVYYTHRYFTASRWRTPAEVYFYFRESILCQSVESPPFSIEIFEPEEAKEALIFFFEIYIRNLPIISILHLPHYKLQLKLKPDKIFKDQSHTKEKKKK